MKRRDVLKTAPAVGTAAGLAGCSSIPFLGGGCSAPSGSPSGVLPSGGGTFTKKSSSSGGGGMGQMGGVQAQAGATYTDGSGNRLSMTVLKFGSKDQAASAAKLLKRSMSSGGATASGTLGLLQVGNWLALVSGPSESKVRSLVGASGFGNGCKGQVEIASSS